MVLVYLVSSTIGKLIVCKNLNQTIFGVTLNLGFQNNFKIVLEWKKKKTEHQHILKMNKVSLTSEKKSRRRG